MKEVDLEQRHAAGWQFWGLALTHPVSLLLHAFGLLKFQNFNAVIPRAGNSRKMQEQQTFSTNEIKSSLIDIP